MLIGIGSQKRVCSHSSNPRGRVGNLLCGRLCHHVEPKLTPLTGEVFAKKTANISEEARLDISARGFWKRGSRTFFDVRVYNTMAKSYANSSMLASHGQNKNEKKRQYNDRALQIEHASYINNIK